MYVYYIFMHIIHINSINDLNKINKIKKFIKNGKDVFILIYMDFCGPCNATRPEWDKLHMILKDDYSHNDDLVIVDINNKFESKLDFIGSIDGYPTLKYIGNYGNIVEPYENSSIMQKNRSVESFVEWIDSKIKHKKHKMHKKGGGTKRKKIKQYLTRKYKKSKHFYHHYLKKI